jgi:hypothetical protein
MLREPNQLPVRKKELLASEPTRCSRGERAVSELWAPNLSLVSTQVDI